MKSQPSDDPQPGATPGAGQNLQRVNANLAEMIETLKRQKDHFAAQRVAGSRAAPTSAPPGGVPPLREPEVPGRQAAVPASETLLRERLGEAEAAGRRAQDELVKAQDQLLHFVGLFVALRRLHEAPDHAEVLDAIQEVVANIVGSEELMVLERAGAGGLVVTRAVGIDPSTCLDLLRPDGSLRAALERGEVLSSGRAGELDPRLNACVPLRVGETTSGALLIFGLLVQKPALTDQDLEVLDLLVRHAAQALRRSVGGSEAGRGA